MKTIISIALILVLLTGGYFAYSATRWQDYCSDSYKKPEHGHKTVAIDQLKDHADHFKGQPLMIEGTISSECPSGCWFYLSNGKGKEIKVELSPSKLAIPQVIGKKARVYGTIELLDNEPIFVGNRVQIK